MERYTLIEDERAVPAEVRQTVRELVDDLTELLHLPIRVAYVRRARPHERGYVTTARPMAGRALVGDREIVLPIDVQWPLGLLEYTVLREAAHLVIHQRGWVRSERSADELVDRLWAALWRQRRNKLRRELLRAIGRRWGRQARPRSPASECRVVMLSETRA